MIISCQHHTGMGLCWICSEEVAASERENNANIKRRSDLLAAAKLVAQYGYNDIAEQIKKKV